MMRQELESVDFYITQGYSDIAFDTPELLERQFGSHPEIQARRKKLEAASQSARATDLEFSDQAATEEIAFGEIAIEQSVPPSMPAAPAARGIDSGLR